MFVIFVSLVASSRHETFLVLGVWKEFRKLHVSLGKRNTLPQE